MLEIKDLHVSVDDREILKGVSLKIKSGETCVLFGPNGSGKSTLLATLMGYGYCKVTSGKIIFKGVDITSMPIDERAKMGMGMMMQRPPNVVGVKLGTLVNTVGGNSMSEKADEFKMSNFMERDLNVGFSGGEIKRSELLQLTAQNPSFLLLDEPESGVDLESIDLVGEKVHDLLYRNGQDCEGKRSTRVIVPQTEPTTENGARASALVITHTGQILNYIGADRAYVLKEGEIRCSGRPADLLKDIRENGYGRCIECRK